MIQSVDLSNSLHLSISFLKPKTIKKKKKTITNLLIPSKEDNHKSKMEKKEKNSDASLNGFYAVAFFLLLTILFEFQWIIEHQMSDRRKALKKKKDEDAEYEREEYNRKPRVKEKGSKRRVWKGKEKRRKRDE